MTRHSCHITREGSVPCLPRQAGLPPAVQGGGGQGGEEGGLTLDLTLVKQQGSRLYPGQTSSLISEQSRRTTFPAPLFRSRGRGRGRRSILSDRNFFSCWKDRAGGRRAATPS